MSIGNKSVKRNRVLRDRLSVGDQRRRQERIAKRAVIRRMVYEVSPSISQHPSMAAGGYGS